MSFLLDTPNIKLHRIVDETVTIILGTSTKKTWKFPSKFLYLVTSIQLQESQTLQTTPIGGLKIDEVPINCDATTSNVNQRSLTSNYLWKLNSSTVTDHPIIPMRQKIEINWDSTAVANGTCRVQIMAYVLEDPLEKFRGVASVEKQLSI